MTSADSSFTDSASGCKSPLESVEGAMIRCISVWQPYAALLVHRDKLGMRHKAIETRPFTAPSTVLGARIGIASTKVIKPEQRAAIADPDFTKHYAETGMPPLEELPHGFLLGTVFVYSSDMITEDDLDDVTDEEQAFGDWRPGRFAWRTKDPELFPEPIPVSGAQGIWIYSVPDYLRRVK